MLYIVATPIGNLEDITLRALRVLKEVDYILAEDTRKTGNLLKHFQVKKKLVSFFEQNEKRRLSQIIQDLKSGKDIALVSDAGTPTISDPGYILVREARKQDVEISVLPGASSITTALTLSSLPHDKFAFLGYFPRKDSQRKKLLEEWLGKKIALVFFESPYRLIKSLKAIESVCPDCGLTIARELTKRFEEVLELSPKQALAHYSDHTPKGEYVLILSK